MAATARTLETPYQRMSSIARTHKGRGIVVGGDMVVVMSNVGNNIF